MTRPTEIQLRTAINEFVFASNWSESRWVLAIHPELLTDEADVILAHIKAMAREKGDTHDVEVTETHQKLLRRCRQIGDRAAFAELTGNDFPPLSADLIQLCDAASGAARSFQENHEARLLGQAIEAFEAGVRARGAVLDHAPFETAEYIVGLAISLRSLRFDVQPRGDDLEAALAFWDSLLQEASGSLAALDARASGIGGSLLIRAHLAGLGTLSAAIEALEHSVSVSPPGPERDGLTHNLDYARRLAAKR
jgi:hypothetical protein